MSAAVVVIEAIPPGSVATRTLPAAPPAPRVILVDAETVTRQGLPLLIPGMDFVGYFPSTESLIEVRPTADVVILDVRLGGPGAVQVLQRAELTEAIRTWPRVRSPSLVRWLASSNSPSDGTSYRP